MAITTGSFAELSDELSSKVGANVIVDAEVSGSSASKTGTSTSRTVTLTVLTGGLDVEQIV